MSRYHMKKDESGVAICHASVKECPNGAFGHWDTVEEVWTAYEASNYDKTLAGSLNKKAISSKARKNLADEKKEALELLRNAKDNEDRNIALSMIPVNDYIWDKFADSSKKDERLWAAKKIDGNKNAIIDFIEYEEDPEVLHAFAENPTLEKDQAKKIYKKLKKLKNYDIQDQHFVEDYTKTVRSMRDDDSSDKNKKTVVNSKSNNLPTPNTIPGSSSTIPGNREAPSKSNKSAIQKLADSKKVSKMITTPEFSKAFNKANFNMREDIKNLLKNPSISDTQKKDLEESLENLSTTKFAVNRKTSFLLGGGTESLSFISTSNTNLSKIPQSIVEKNIGKVFKENNIDYNFKNTGKGLEFSFVSDDDLKKLEFDLKVVQDK